MESVYKNKGWPTSGVGNMDGATASRLEFALRHTGVDARVKPHNDGGNGAMMVTMDYTELERLIIKLEQAEANL